jgi:GMP synthase (glutamine-hydrolysing)
MADVAVLVVEHEAGAPGGWLEDGLRAAGCELDVRRPYAGEPLPAPEQVEDFGGVVVLGGSMAAWDDAVAPWLPGTRAIVRAGEAAGVPTLGICLGHQLAAKALGGDAAPNPAGPTVAVVPVCWADTAAADPLFAGIRDTPMAVHWNNDVVSAMPPGAEVLATSPDGEVQAARLGRRVWGVQFHPEAGAEIIGRWVREDGATYVEAGYDLDQYLTDIRRHEPELIDSCRRLADSFAGMVRAR